MLGNKYHARQEPEIPSHMTNQTNKEYDQSGKKRTNYTAPVDMSSEKPEITRTHDSNPSDVLIIDLRISEERFPTLHQFVEIQWGR